MISQIPCYIIEQPRNSLSFSFLMQAIIQHLQRDDVSSAPHVHAHYIILYLQTGRSSRSYRIARDTSMSSAQGPVLAIACSIMILTAMLPQ